MRRSLVVMLAVPLMLGSPDLIVAQDIKAELTPKMAPAGCPGDCTQIYVYNATPHSEEIEMRKPGGNWLSFTLQPRTRYNYRCHDCADGLEGRLADGDTVSIAPGTDYELRYGSSREVMLVPQRGQ